MEEGAVKWRRVQGSGGGCREVEEGEQWYNYMRIMLLVMIEYYNYARAIESGVQFLDLGVKHDSSINQS